MECIIDKFKFTLVDKNTISVCDKSTLATIKTFLVTKEIDDKKEFDIECSDWYFKNA